jgi:hypothetical protein
MVFADAKRLKKAFAEFECEDDAVWDSAAGLAAQFGMDAHELTEKYELFALNKYACDCSNAAPVSRSGISHPQRTRDRQSAFTHIQCRKKLQAPITVQMFNAFADFIKKEKMKENTSVENHALSVPAWTGYENDNLL